MHPDIKELTDLLDAAESLLLKHGEDKWAQWLSKDSSRIKSLDLYVVEHLLSAFGGMGSINDLVIHPENGHSITENEVEAVNAELGALLGRVVRLAKRLYGEEANARHST